MDSKDPRQVDGIEPEQCADAILRAATLIQAQQIPVSAMVDLFNQGLLADFMDVLLPDAPQTYRDTVAQIVIKVLQDGGGDEDEDDDDDDDEDSDEATNGTAVVSQQAGSPVAAPTPQARA